MKTRSQAEELCAADGARLAEVRTTQDFNDLFATIGDCERSNFSKMHAVKKRENALCFLSGKSKESNHKAVSARDRTGDLPRVRRM